MSVLKKIQFFSVSETCEKVFVRADTTPPQVTLIHTHTPAWTHTFWDPYNSPLLFSETAGEAYWLISPWGVYWELFTVIIICLSSKLTHKATPLLYVRLLKYW